MNKNDQGREIKCNICGLNINKNQFDYLDDYLLIEKRWGYSSPYDNEEHKIVVCISCYDDLLSKLEIKDINKDIVEKRASM